MRAHLKTTPDPDDYTSATDYLSLIASSALVEATVKALRRAELTHRKAKDLLRASELAVLPVDNSELRERLQSIVAGKKLSPVLLVRGGPASLHALVVADGYHRICASYILDDTADIPCRIADLATG